MKAMILAAGRGERMRPLTDTCPKPLLKAGKHSLIGWHLKRLKTAGFDQIVINHAWLGNQIEATLGDGSEYGVSIQYSPEGEKGLETAGGIATALPLLGNEPFLVVNGDVLTDLPFEKAHQLAHDIDGQKSLAYLWLVPNPEHNPQGDFYLNHNQVMSEAPNSEMQAYTFSGSGIYHPALFADIAPNQIAKLAPLLRKAMNQTQVMGGLHTGFWLDVGTPERLAEAAQTVQSPPFSTL